MLLIVRSMFPDASAMVNVVVVVAGVAVVYVRVVVGVCGRVVHRIRRIVVGACVGVSVG